MRACGAGRDEGGTSNEVVLAGEGGFDLSPWGLSR